jgi:hypothetical protein
VEIDSASKDLREFGLHPEEGQAWDMAGLEFYEHVDVAGTGKILPQHGAEQRKFADVIAPAECGDDLTARRLPPITRCSL